MSVTYCVNEYAKIIKTDGNVEREELKNILKLDTFLDDKYKDEKSLDEVVDKIYSKIDDKVTKLSIEERFALRLKLYNQGMDDDEIAKIEGASSATVGQWRINKKLPKHIDHRKKNLEELHKKRLELYNKGLTDEEIGKELNTKVKTITAWRWKQKLK